MKYVKKPIVVEAIRLGQTNQEEIEIWSDYKAVRQSGTEPWQNSKILNCFTLEGSMRAKPGDWIIKGIKGEFYPCKHEIFMATYDPVKETQ